VTNVLMVSIINLNGKIKMSKKHSYQDLQEEFPSISPGATSSYEKRVGHRYHEFTSPLELPAEADSDERELGAIATSEIVAPAGTVDAIRISEEEREKILLDPRFEILTQPDRLPSRQEIIDTFTERYSDLDEFRGNSGIFEILNRDYVNALADYLQQRADEMHTDKPITVLEVGAGTGRLSQFLNEAIQKKKKGPDSQINIVATNKDSGGMVSVATPKGVEDLDYREALLKYEPDIVISSWMPFEDWTGAMRSMPSVQEYILIGEPDSTGDEWLTWGNSNKMMSELYDEISDLGWNEEGEFVPLSPDEEAEFKKKEEQIRKTPPPYEIDGFQKKELYELTDLQTPLLMVRSQTIAFRRQ
jgi:SAM-dependent methyltransferase